MRTKYQSPLGSRYASDEMLYIFSEEKKFRTWRLLWIALAETQKELGLLITQEQIEEMIQYKDDINYEEAAAFEKELRHDVMAHVYAYGKQCPSAKAIIHLGATSCYVGDNADLLLMREALTLIQNKIYCVMNLLKDFAVQYKDLPTLGYTHFQPAQLTTVGKRACLWLHDLLLDLEELQFVLSHLKFLGSKGTTGTQASFLHLFDDDSEKVALLEKKIAEKFGFSQVYPVSGQTYSRKVDSQVLHVLSAVAQSSAKFSNDLRLLQHLKEIEEPFEKQQIGSSAMAYKRNPMRSERMAALCRYVISDAQNAALTASSQWFERTLDDSANKRIAVPEAFLAVDAILNLYLNIAAGLVVYPKVIRKHVEQELPFMATENILMAAVKKGGDRQVLHERIRIHSMASAQRIKEEGLENDLAERIAGDPSFQTTREDILSVLRPAHYVGLAPKQAEDFIQDYIDPVLDNCPQEAKQMMAEVVPIKV